MAGTVRPVVDERDGLLTFLQHLRFVRPRPERFRVPLSEVVSRIAAKDFAGLKRAGIDRYPDADLSMWIRNYGQSGVTVVPLPDEAWDIAEAIPVDARPGEWAVVVGLWTAEEGHSDLSMEATVIESDDGVQIFIDGIHVL